MAHKQHSQNILAHYGQRNFDKINFLFPTFFVLEKAIFIQCFAFFLIQIRVSSYPRSQYNQAEPLHLRVSNYIALKTHHPSKEVIIKLYIYRDAPRSQSLSNHDEWLTITLKMKRFHFSKTQTHPISLCYHIAF